MVSLPVVPQMSHVAPTTLLRTVSVLVCWPPPAIVPRLQDRELGPFGWVQPPGSGPASTTFGPSVAVSVDPGAAALLRLVTTYETLNELPVGTTFGACTWTLRFVVATGMRVKVAVTVVSAVMGRTQLPLPEQPPPDQPVNVEPPAGDAVNVTTVALENVSVQVTPQAIPEGALVTVPAPVPALTTVKVRRE